MRPHVLALVVALLGALVVVGPGRAHAARFQVQPTRVDLAGTHHVGSLAVTNRSTEEVRFQITAMAWTESEDGTTGLTPTDELVVYPSLFTLAPGDSRSVRVTSMASPGAREVPYRIFVEELPPLRSFRQMHLEELIDGSSDAAVTSAWQRKLISLWSTLAPHLPESVRDLRALTRGAEGPGAYADRLAAALVGDPDGSQRLLAELDPAERLRLLTEKLQQVHDSVAPPSPGRRTDLN